MPDYYDLYLRNLDDPKSFTVVPSLLYKEANSLGQQWMDLESRREYLIFLAGSKPKFDSVEPRIQVVTANVLRKEIEAAYDRN